MRTVGLEYPVVLEPDEDTVLLTFPDVPQAVTFGEDEDEALAHGVDALITIMWAMMNDAEDIPMPSKPKPGQPTVALPPLVASKILLYNTMREEGVSKAELARRLGNKAPTHVTRLLDLTHKSRHDQLDEAMAVLNHRLVVSAEPLPPMRRSA
ncbi:MAG: type II toxin-antitoxin system HicB family antitoxin [Dehalococcoidia bacterium]